MPKKNKSLKLHFTTAIVALLILAIPITPNIINHLFSAIILDTACSDFNNGTHTNTECDAINDELELSTAQTSGSYESAVSDATSSGTWTNFAWTAKAPYGKELVDNKGSESGYTSGNIDMSNNIALWHLNESSGSILDTSGNINTGTLTGGAYSATAKLSTGISMDGSDYIDVADHNDFSINTTGSLSTSFWFNPGTDTSAQEGILTKGGTNTDSAFEWSIQQTTGQIQAVITSSVGNTIRMESAAISADTWYHVAVVFTGSTNTSDILIYLNGVESSTLTSSGAYSYSNGSGKFRIGQRYAGHSSRTFTGTIDEVAIWNDQLTSTEALDLYKRGIQNVQYQMRSCDDPACSGETYLGPDGTTATYYNELTSPTTSTPFLTITNLIANRYFQYKATFTTENVSYLPEISDVSITNNTTGATTTKTHDEYVDTEISGGTFSNTQWDTVNTWIELNLTGLTTGSGTFTSPVINATSTQSWTTLAWNPERPSYKEVMDNKGAESGYTVGNIDMTNNVGLWHLNEASGSILDTSGNSHNGTMSGGTYEVAAKLNTGISMAGAGYIGIADHDDFSINTTGSLSTSFWINPGSDITTREGIISKGGTDSTTNHEWAIEKEGGAIYAAVTANNGSTIRRESAPITANVWQHVTVVYTGSTYTDNILIYINGVENSTLSLSANNAYANSATELGIGKFYGASGWRNLNGTLDEIAIWNDQLTATEAMDLYKRAIQRTKFQVRSCNDSACDTETFIGPNGTSGTYYSELTNTTTTTPSLTLTNITDNQYFQYQATLETDIISYSPEINSITTNSSLLPESTITESSSSTDLVEGGATDTYTIAFSNVAPTSDVTVTITADNVDASVSPSSLTFTSGNYTVAQTVTVSAIDDNSSEGDHTSTITHAITSLDGNYSGLAASSVVANITDNDVLADYIDSDNTTGGFLSGTHSNTQWNTDHLEMNGTGISAGTATYTSRIMDGSSSKSWTNLAWTTNEANGKELVRDATTETGYTDNLSMAGNVLNMHLNESGTATSFLDESGNDNHGTAIANATGGAIGKLNNAATLDGTTDYISVADDATLDITDAITMSAWIKTSTTNKGIISKGSYNGSSNGDYAITILNASQKPRCTINNTTFVDASTTVVTDGVWHHVACTYDKNAGGTDELKIYIDGALEGSTDYSTTINTNSEPLKIGAYYSSTYVFNGQIDEVGVWSRALAAAEINQIYKRAITNVKLQVRSCDDNACSGESFVGPDGTSGTFYTELMNSGAGNASVPLTNVNDNQYFQYQVTFENNDLTSTADILSVTLTNTITTAHQSDYIDNNFSNTGFGTYSTSTFWDAVNSVLRMARSIFSSSTTTYTSRIMDSTSISTVWGNLSWDPYAPYNKELPNNKGVETAYTNGNIDMTNNAILLHMDETSWSGVSGEAVDDSGNGYNGTAVGNATTTSNGKLNYAGTFDGTGDYVDHGSNTSLNDNTDKTVSMWIKIASKTSADRIFTKNKNTSAIGYAFAFETDGDLVAVFTDETEMVKNFGNLSTGTWYHVAAVYDESAGTVATYVNGVEISTTGGASWGYDTNDNLLIGGRVTGSQYFDGQIDEFGIWNQAFSTSEIINLYKRGTINLKFQLRSCDDSACSGETFTGPGSISNFYSEVSNSAITKPSISLSPSDIPNNRYIQYQVTLDNGSTTYEPLLSGVTLAINNPTIEFTSTSSSGAESTSSPSFELTRSEIDGTTATTVNYTITGIATGSGTDYTLADGTATITAGNTTTTISPTIIDDALYESSETIIITISNPTNAILGTNTTYTYTITDNDTAPTVTLSLDNNSISETGGTSLITATLSAVSGQDVTVNLAYTGTATNSLDYSYDASLISITAGNTSGTATVTAVTDSDYELSETIIIDIDSINNGTENGTQQETVTITDDDQPIITLSIDDTSISEVTETATLTATASSTALEDITVNLAFSGTATGSGTDYNASASSITISSGQSTGTMTVTSIDDETDETNETIIVDISSVTNGTESGTQVKITTITDNDDPTVTISIDSSTLLETAGTATVTATASAIPAEEITVNLAFTGTATGSGTDYTASASTITISTSSTTGTMTITGVEDSTDEATETIIIDISSISNGTESGTQQQTINIIDDDNPTVTLTIDQSSISEANETATITATASAIPAEEITVNLAFTGTATGSETDYTQSASTITISTSSTTGTMTITSVDNSTVATDKTIIIDIDSITNGTENSIQQKILTITNEDVLESTTSSTPSGSSTSPSMLAQSNITLNSKSSSSNKTSGEYELKTNKEPKNSTTEKVETKKEIKEIDKLAEKTTNSLAFEFSGNIETKISLQNSDSKAFMTINKDTNITIAKYKVLDQNGKTIIEEAKDGLKSFEGTINAPEIASSEEKEKTIKALGGKGEMISEVFKTNIKEIDTKIKFDKKITIALPINIRNEKEFNFEELNYIVESKDNNKWEYKQKCEIKKSDDQFFCEFKTNELSTFTIIQKPNPFNDIKNHWAKDYIVEMHGKQIAKGYSEGNFKPNNEMSRAEFTKVALLSMKYEIPKKISKTSFKDIKTLDWSAPYIETALERKLISGFSDGTFKPENNITRAEALKILLEASGINLDTRYVAEFSDIDQKEWHSKYINFAAKEGVIKGFKDGTFKPNGPITRAEVAKINSMIQDRL